MRNSIIREASDLFLTLVALLLAVATLVLVFTRPPQSAPEQAAAGPPTVIPPSAPTPTMPSTPDALAAQPGELPAPTLQPTPGEVVAVAAADGYEVYTDPFDQIYSEHYRQLAGLTGLTNDRYVKLVVRPLERPDLEVNFEGEEYQNAASTLKAAVLLYAIFRDPQVALSGWQADTSLAAYKMIVGSHNSATGTVLNDSRDRQASGNSLDQFNDFLHDIIGLPPSVGLTQWNYGATQDYLSFRVDAADRALDPDRVAANPITLDALVASFEFLETPNWVEGAISRASATPGYPLHAYESYEAYRADVLAAVAEAKRLMTIPDPERPTEIELALTRAQIAHPELQISMYGKNGSLGPNDWPEDRWHVNEAAVITVGQGERSARCIVAYSASQFENGRLLDGALAYCVALFEQSLVATN